MKSSLKKGLQALQLSSWDREFSKRESLILWGFLLALFLLLTFQVLMPKWAQLQDLSGRVALVEGQMSPVQAQDLVEIEEGALSGLKSSLKAGDVFLEPLVLNRLAILESNLGSWVIDQNIMRRDLSLKVRGGFRDIGEYLEELVTRKPTLILERVSFSLDPESEMQHVSLHIEGGIYAKK